MAETTWLLRRLGEVGSETVFIDGTKIEANANKYTFVWKKAGYKNLAKMMEKITSLVAECEASYGLHIVYHDRISRSASGYRSTVTIYRCDDCKGCPYKEKCIKGNNCKTPMEERNKVLYVSKIKEKKRKEDLERILSDRGIQLRMNRSIQVEGSFATVKEDMNFRQYLYRGNTNVLAQSILVAIAHNINKLHHKIQSGRTGTHLFPLKKTG